MRAQLWWRSRLTGAIGHGEPLEQFQDCMADAWIVRLNREHPEIEHWFMRSTW